VPPRNDENNAMQLLEHFRELTLHPKNAEELKGLILQLAVQGKLTQKWREENPDVEPASVLLGKIKAEKARLVRERKIKKDNPVDEITDEEILFCLPESWEWCRLGEYVHNFGQKSPDQEFEYIDVASIDNKQGKIKDELEILQPNLAPSRARKIVKKGCVLYSTVRPYLLNIAIVDREFTKEAIASTAFAILNPMLGCSELFLYHLLRSNFFINYVESCMKGVAYPAINDANLLNGPIPIPPLAEQKAIVEVVNQLFAEVEQLEALTKERIQLKEDFVTSALNQLTQAAESDVANHWELVKSQFGTFFTEKSSIKKLREAILQLAVQGKLTHHWRSLTS
jgi:type I restriction enzyme, S subunit